MNQEYLKHIYRVAQEYSYRKTKKGTVKDGPYWFGYWRESGKDRRVYVGKELPPELEVILASRRKPPGRVHYSWPGRPQEA